MKSFYLALLSAVILFAGCSKSNPEINKDNIPQYSLSISYDGKNVFNNDRRVSYWPFLNNPTVIYDMVFETYPLISGNTGSHGYKTLADGNCFKVLLMFSGTPAAGDYNVGYLGTSVDILLSANSVSSFKPKLCSIYYWGASSDNKEWTHMEGNCKISNLRKVDFENPIPEGLNRVNYNILFDGKFNIKFKDSEGKQHTISGSFKNQMY